MKKNYILVLIAIVSLFAIFTCFCFLNKKENMPTTETTVVTTNSENSETTEIATTESPKLDIPEKELLTLQEEVSDYKLLIEQKEIKLPMKFPEFVKITNLSPDIEELSFTLKTNEYKTIVVSNDNIVLNVSLINISDKKDASVDDYMVFKISCSAPNIKQPDNQPIILPESAQINLSTQEDLIKLYGKPTTITNNENSNYVYLEWDLSSIKHDEYSFFNATIDKENNLLYEFTYSKSPY